VHNPSSLLTGHNHITLNVGGAQEDYDFHTKILGLKSVKKTLLYDGQAPIYHMYYGNDTGEQSTLVTCFPFRHAGMTAKKGSGQVSILALSVPESSLPFWHDRLHDHGFETAEAERFGEKRIAFQHPCGIDYELVGVADDGRTPATHAEVPSENGIRGVHGIICSVRDLELSDQFMQTGWGSRRVADDGNAVRYEMGAGGAGAIVDYMVEPNRAPGSWTFGEGYIHHCAFSVGSLDEQMSIKLFLEGMGFTDVSDVKDRGYFYSIYVRTPGGPLFEATYTKPEQWTIDEPAESIGAQIMISPQFEDNRAELLAQLETIEY
jgi:glyoxalase family protein